MSKEELLNANLKPEQNFAGLYNKVEEAKKYKRRDKRYNKFI